VRVQMHHVILYGFEREGKIIRMRVSENRLLRKRIFGPKIIEVA
jgi:hypothetical protein